MIKGYECRKAFGFGLAVAAVLTLSGGWRMSLKQSLGTRAMMAAPSRPPRSASALVLASALRLAEPDVAYGRLPLSFEPNVGQAGSAPDSVKFLSRGAGYALFLTSNEAVLALGGGRLTRRSETHDLPDWDFATRLFPPRPMPATNVTPVVLRMRLMNANPGAQAEGAEELPGRINYFLGKEPSQWRSGVPTFARVRYEEVYPGVNLEYYGTHRRLEYDFVVSPGADPRTIAFEIKTGSSRPLRIDSSGALVIETGEGVVRMPKPVVYQPGIPSWRPRSAVSERRWRTARMDSGQSRLALNANLKSKRGNRKLVEGRYILKGAHEVGFEVATHDPAQPLVIDPVLTYSTYLGGSRSDFGTGIAVDSSGDAYVTGYTFSADFPTENPAQVFAGSTDAFVTKLNPTGSALIYSTYLGGSADDLAAGIAVDSSGNAYVTGSTDSLDFPTQNAVQSANAGGTDAFVTKLNPTGALSYSTYLGGAFTDVGQGIAVDASGSAYLTGSTLSLDFPTENALQNASGGGYDAFVTKLNPSGAALVYSTYLGGSADENNPFLSNVNTAGIAVDSAGNAYVAGYTPSNDFPTRNAFQTGNHGFINAFVSKLNASGSALIYSTYLGGHGNDFGHAIAVDSAGNAYVTGSASSSEFPTLNGLPLSLSSTSNHAFLAKLAASGSLVYSTLLGGSFNDFGLGVAVDQGANAYVTGFTNSPDFPTVSPLQGASAGGYDVFVTKFAAAGATLTYSTYLGGSRDDHGAAIAVDAQGNAYVTGDTLSPNFPASGGAFKTSCGADGNCGSRFSGPTPDAFVARISPIDAPGATLSSLGLSFGNQPLRTASPAQAVTLRNAGSQPLVLRRILAVPSRHYSQTNNCPASLDPATSCTISVTFSPAATGALRGFLIVLDNAWPRGSQIVKLVGNGE
ncbi:MAG TPA: SBBP repeat-containing protein [Terriglobia bacterium]|nr:SBBP repeat-containing protein [Terriglobia bacterium]